MIKNREIKKENPIIAYKGFDKNLKCRDFQYEVGKEYNIDGNIECCKHGFHACKSPMDTWSVTIISRIRSSTPS